MLTLSAAAQSGGSGMWWGIYNGNQTLENLGVNDPVLYEAAIHINGGTDALLEGATLTALRLPLMKVDNLADITLWVTSDLNGDKLAQVAVTDPVVGMNTVELPQPITIPAEGLYVGCSLRVTQIDNGNNYDAHPLPVVSVKQQDGLWLRIPDRESMASWTNYSSQNYGSLAIQVRATSEQFAPYAVEALSLESINAVAGQANTFYLTVANWGSEPVQAISYSYHNGEQELQGVHTLEQPLEAVYGKEYVVPVQLNTPSSTLSELTMALQVQDINGNTNSIDNEAVEASYLNLLRQAHHNTVMEEYTGTWCSFCPRGMVGIRNLKALYPDNFIALCVHYYNNDPMQIEGYESQLPVEGFPICNIDRTYLTDPYLGYNVVDASFQVDTVFELANRILSVADINLTAHWNTEATTPTVDINSQVEFLLHSDDCPYRLCYVMTEDSLTGTTSAWAQKNSFPALADQYTSDDMWEFTHGSNPVTGLYYDDVVIAVSEVNGIEGSINAPLMAGDTQTHKWQMTVPALSQNINRIHITALLIDTNTGHIVNAARVPVTKADGIIAVQADDTSNEVTTYYRLDGIQVATPNAPGIYLKKQGTTVTKILTR